MNKQTSAVLLLLMLFCAGCSDTKKTQQKQFVFPEIIDTIKTAVHYYSPNLLTVPVNYIRTIRKVGTKADLLDTTAAYRYADDYPRVNKINESSTNQTGLTIFVDTTREVPLDLSEGSVAPFIFDDLPEDTDRPKSKTQRLIDSIKFAVKQQAWEENKTFVKGFPVYLVNQSTRSVSIEEQDVRIIMIQEAMDKSGQWKPVEFWQFSSCGNSYGSVVLRPEYYLMTKVVKYKGSFDTLLRLKLLNGKELCYSQPYKGSINMSQLNPLLLKYKVNPDQFLVPNK